MKKEKRFIAVPEVWDEGGIPLIAIPVGAQGRAMTLGVGRARAIVKYYPDIEKFVNSCEEQRHEAKHGKRGIGQEAHSN